MAEHPIGQLMSACRRGLAWLAIVAASWALLGCGSLPKDVERPVSSALAAGVSTPLGELARSRRSATARPGDSGFALIDSANKAYASRLALTQGATRTLDVQSYAIHADSSSAELLREMRVAAARGVRVRILLDDFHATGRNAVILRMAFVPNVEMRMYNPLPGGRGSGVLRALGALHDFTRIQHRMHNKLFIADNAWGITGGRNLGDAYFGTAEGSNFIDLDVLAAGPVVRDMSASFDRYWNSPLAYPVQSLITREELQVMRDQYGSAASGTPTPMSHGAADVRPSAPTVVKASPASPPLDLRQLPLVWAAGALLVDKPLKLLPEISDDGTQDTVVDGMLGLMKSAQRDVLIVSPYFVPGAAMMRVFADLRRRDVRVRVLTNSLSSNDAPLAHVGYARYRDDLLKIGVELHEMRALHRGRLDRTMLGSGDGGSKASLHAKLFIIDGRIISIGSMNLDLRSQLQNTEVALVVRSRTLSGEAARQVDDTLDDGAWRLERSPEGRLRWRAPPGAPFEDATSEPDASLPLRLMLMILGPFAPDELL